MAPEVPRVARETVKAIAQGISGLGGIKEEVSAALAPDAEYRVREIIQEAIKFMRHARRTRLTTSDINDALRLRNVEPLYGLCPPEQMRFCKVPGVTSGGELYYLEDKEVELRDVISKPLPPVPLAPALRAHWLAIEGIQPTIAQNPPTEGAGSNAAEETGGEGETEAGQKKRARVSVEMEVKPLVKHVLSRELQLYYDHIVKTVRGDSEDALSLAVNNVAQEPGLQHLLPYFSLFIHDEVMTEMKQRRNLRLLTSCMRLARALLSNTYLNLEPYLHQLLPPTLTCLVGKRLSRKPTEDHWSLRDYAGSLVGDICQRHGSSYASLQTRITKTLVGALLDQNRPLTTHYGAIVGLSTMGPHVLQVILIPNLESYVVILEEELNSEQPAPPLRKYEIAKVYGAIMTACSKYAKDSTSNDPDGDEEEQERGGIVKKLDIEEKDKIKAILPEFESRYESMYDEFGDALFPSIPSGESAAILAKSTL